MRKSKSSQKECGSVRFMLIACYQSNLVMQEKTAAYESYPCTLRELQLSLTVEVNLTFAKHKCYFLLQEEYKKKEASELDEKLQFLQSFEELIRTSSFFEDFPLMMDLVNSFRRFYKRTIIPSDREEEEKW